MKYPELFQHIQIDKRLSFRLLIFNKIRYTQIRWFRFNIYHLYASIIPTFRSRWQNQFLGSPLSGGEGNGEFTKELWIWVSYLSFGFHNIWLFVTVCNETNLISECNSYSSTTTLKGHKHIKGFFLSQIVNYPQGWKG